VLQTSVSIADQEAIGLTLPLARQKQMGVIAKRPLANVAWRYTQKPANSYHLPYWERLQQLAYDFTQGDPKQAVGIALRFTLSVPGVHTAIVGTTKPGRWRENAELLAAGPLPAETFERIRARWRAVADKSWVGQI
jgi:aryl-alcohol dehydrogenase-like predicted oxidoreductase